jgi:hypothetical protein
MHEFIWKVAATATKEGRDDVLPQSCRGARPAWLPRRNDDQGREPAAQQPAGPPRWKLAALNWFGICAVITPMLALAEPWLDPLPLVARTFAIAVVLVPATVFVIMPALARAFRSWLQR